MTWLVALIGIASGGPLEQSARRTRTVADDRRLGKELQRFLPELEPQIRSTSEYFRSCRADSRWTKVSGRRLQVRRRRPGQSRHDDQDAEDHQAGSPFQMKQREYRQHDRDRDHRRPRDDHERHVDDEAERDRDKHQRLPDPVCLQQADDRIGQRHRTQRELLALVDVVLDEDAASPRLAGGFSERLGSIMRRSTTSPSAGRKTPGMRRRPTSRATTVRNDRTVRAAPTA